MIVPGLSFLSPWFLAGMAAVGIPILLHLFARQAAQEVRFSATRFVPAAPVEFVKRRRVTDLLLLLLRCVALVLLALAFARPYFTDAGTAANTPVTLVAIDTSLSMSGADTWRAAQAEAVKAIDAAPSGAPVAVLGFDAAGRVVFPASADRGAARRAVEELRPGAGSTSLAAIVPPALEALAERPGTLVVVTDRQRSGLGGVTTLPAGVDVRFAVVPAARDNLGVADVERAGSDLEAAIVNGGLTDRDAEAQLEIDGAVIARQPASVPASGTVNVRFAGASRERGVAVVRVVDVGGLAADDARTLVLDRPAGLRVLLVVNANGTDTGGFYVRRALESSPRTQPVDVQELVLPASAWTGQEAQGDPDVILLLGTRGLGRELRERLASLVQAGTGLLVAVGPDVEAGSLREWFGGSPALRIEQIGEGQETLAFAPLDVRHAVFSPYSDRSGAFSRVRFEQAVRIAPDASTRVLAAFDNGLPALAEYAAGRGRVLLLATDLDARWNQWPVSPTFVPFLRESVGYLAQKRGQAQEFLVGHAPAGVGGQPGVHVLEDGRRVAVNVDPRESSLDLAEVDELAAQFVSAPAPAEPAPARVDARRESQQSVWRYLLLALAAALVGESLLSARRAVRA